MISGEMVRNTLKRMKEIRASLVKDYPFYGELAMLLELGVAEVGTALTNMKQLIVDPHFALQLDDRQLQFVFMHEILHCALFHCTRRDGRDRFRWNVACDIVVNSNLLQNMGISEMTICGERVMHLDPFGLEGYQFHAEEMYERLKHRNPEEMGQNGNTSSWILDNHEYWDETDPSASEQDEWRETMINAAKNWAGKEESIAAGVLKELEVYQYKRQIRWKQICRDFIRKREVGSDYNFRPPDRRFEDSEFIYPGLNPAEDDVVEDVLFCVDKSGSISVDMIKAVMKELEGALHQIKGLNGMLMFFDTKVYDPISFSNKRELLKHGVPAPSGGTSFHPIFRYVHKKMKNKPSGVVILTDGYAPFPSASEIKGLPTLWIIVDSEQKPLCGKYVHINRRYFSG